KNQLDGEFLGNPTALGTYEDLLPNGQYRPGLSGDSIPGGSFATAFVVVPKDNIIYAKPDYADDRLLTNDDPDGSLAKPYPTLAPEAANNDVSNFFNFNTSLDRNGNGHFDRSAFIAARDRVAATGK